MNISLNIAAYSIQGAKELFEAAIAELEKNQETIQSGDHMDEIKMVKGVQGGVQITAWI